MIELPLPFLIVAALGLFILGYTLGWDKSVDRWRAERDRTRQRQRQLEEDITELARQLEREPIQLGIQTGRDFVLERLEHLIQEIRSQ